ncbi:hypothetical protein FCM35_KLT02361 [Carex littledalei]|uniref:KIB1-4 beta-propeller domain-containing protein n=1 Tax=Carex littledalei TaxID=544730 RepID=A0A833R036_9POAL|nr:hypothetical protein FCM35_KLT02361 [Carex littledalei]
MYTPQSICFASSTASTLVVLTGRQVAYAVPGLNKWKFVANRNPHAVVDMAHTCFQSYTHVFSLAITGSVLKPLIACINLGMAPLLWDVASLVESDGEVLLISRTRGKDGIIDFSFVRVFKVVIEEGVGGEEKAAHLVPLNNIGKRAVFINKVYGSFSVSTDVFPWIKPNSIYYYQANSLKMYHPGGLCCTSLDPNVAPPGYCYWLDPDDNIQFINESISVFPAFQSPTPRGSSPYQ